MMTTRTNTLGEAKIGPAAWRTNTMKGIKTSESIIKRSEKSTELGHKHDPLPHLRETVAELSNAEAHKYFRQTRSVVCQLRECLIDTNEEIKALTRAKEALEKTLEYVRKDIKLNQDSSELRKSRPTRKKKKVPTDDVLSGERQHLLNVKRMLETHLRLVQQQLRVLDAARRRLARAVKERSRVLDLICHALPAASAGLMTTRASRTMRPYASAYDKYSHEPPVMSDIDPLGAYSPESDQALQEAQEAQSRSSVLRKDSAELINIVDRVQKAAHDAVNTGLTQKVAETVSLKQRLDTAAGDTRHATNRAQRWFDSTEKALANARGPVSSSDMTTREKLERPVIRVYQRHPGTEVPEAQHIVRGGAGLLESLVATNQNIGLLKLAQLQLRDDLRDKSAARDVDSAIIRMRRRKADHRWAMGAAF